MSPIPVAGSSRSICVALIAILSVLYGLIHLIPVVGDIADSIVWPFLMLLGFGQAVLLIGMVGYPLMYATISAEGSDTFDALSRSYNYVLQSPWNYIWYSIVAVVYGAVLVFFVGFRRLDGGLPHEVERRPRRRAPSISSAAEWTISSSMLRLRSAGGSADRASSRESRPGRARWHR